MRAARAVTRAVASTGEEVWLVARLTGSLLWALHSSARWVAMALRLFLYVFLLLPAFVRMAFHWLFSPSLARHVRYGANRRNRVDVYRLSAREEERGGHPVVVFMTGGAWIIGYKMWGCLMGMVLQRQGVLFLAPDYRNFPQGTISDMVEDASSAVQWALDHCEAYGGDSRKVYLIGQSAGSHISALALLRRAEREAAEGPSMGGWRARDLRCFMGISGPADLVAMEGHFHGRGLDRSIQGSIFEGDLVANSPRHRVEAWSPAEAGLLPPMLLAHGTGDASCPFANSVAFADALKASGAGCVGVKLYPGKSHTDPILEDPMDGDDPLIEDIMYLVRNSDTSAAVRDVDNSGGAFEEADALLAAKKLKFFSSPLGRRMLPRCVINLARWVNPF